VQAYRRSAVRSNVTASISGLTITGGMTNGDGGGLNSQGTITLTDCSITGNNAKSYGGGIFVVGGGATTLTNCIVSGNTSANEGGGLTLIGGSAMLTGCTISGNTAPYGGGGLYADNESLSLTSCHVSGNSSGQSGGGVFIESNSSTTLTGCTISGNTSAIEGGGLAQIDGSLSLTDCDVSDNTADLGGGLAFSHGSTPMTLTNCAVSGNTATDDRGGGLFIYSAATVLNNCTVSGNTAFASGGGMYTYIGGVPENALKNTLTNCTFSGNTAGQSGGGIGARGDVQAQFSDCTISGNTASRSGGGLYLYTSPYYPSLQTSEIGNTIVAGNTAASSGPDASGTFVSKGNNLIGETDGSSGWVGTDLTGTSAQPLNPLLAPLGNFGGPTQAMALLPGSPAINTGVADGGITTDERGAPRASSGPVDTGAFQDQGYTVAVASGSGQSTTIGNAFPNPLVAVLTENFANSPIPGATLSFAAPTSGASAALSTSSATTNASGQASITAVANRTAGNYAVTASATGVATTAEFSLTNISNQPNLQVTDAGGVYDGSAFSATATISPNDGPSGDTLEGVGITFTYYVGTDTNGTDLGNNAPSNAGTYTVVADFPGSTDSWSFTGAANYNNLAITTITDTINKAALTITANNESKTFGNTLTFSGTEFTPSGLFTGDSVKSVTLTSAGAAASAAAGT
jgi:parallel beta-helix repeat protein